MVKRCITATLVSGIVVVSGLIAVLQAATPYPGYTFFASGTKAYLYDMNKTLVHTWTLPYSVVGNAVLLRDSSIYFTSSNANGWNSGGALCHGRFQRIKWDGTVSWTYTYASSLYCPHHNFEAIYYTDDPGETPTVLAGCYTSKGDKVVEIKPTGATTADVVWEWVGSEHMGDNDAALLSSTKGSMGGSAGVEWMHTNYVSLHRGLNQVVVDAKNFNEVLVVDHSTTTAQAATRTGGIYGKGGDILYRWGNPSNYGVTGTAQLNGQHSGSWVPDTFPGTTDTLPGRRNIIIVNNGADKAVEIVPAGTGNGIYPRTTDAAFAPASPLVNRSFAFQTGEGSIQRLPGGNTLLCAGGVGGTGGISSSKILEVSATGDSLWGFTPTVTTTRAWRYALTYMGKAGTSSIAANAGFSGENLFSLSTNPANGLVTVRLGAGQSNALFSVFTVDGVLLHSALVRERTLSWNAGSLGRGIYVARATVNGKSATKRFVIAR